MNSRPAARVRANDRIQTRRAARVKADAQATVVGTPANACVRLNTGDCTTGTDPSTGTGTGGNTVAPVIAGDTTATAGNLADAAACLRINAGDCADANRGIGDPATSDTTNTVPPRGIALLRTQAAGTPANACVRLNTGDCTTGTDPGTGTGTNPTMPMIGSRVTLTASDVAGGVACAQINGGACGETADSPKETGAVGGVTGGGGGSDAAVTDRAGSDPAGFGRLGAEADRFGGNGSVKGIFEDAVPVATAEGIIRFGDGVLGSQLFGGLVQPVTNRLALDPSGSGKESQLAHTGSSAAMLALLLAGLLSSLMAGPMLARRRQR